MLLVALLLMSGCQQPSEVTLTSEQQDSNLELRPIVQSDTSVSVASVDSTGILPQDQLRFGAWLTVTHVIHDNGQVRNSFSYSRVIFSDSVVRINNKTVGFRGMDLGSVFLNSQPMFRIDHRVIAWTSVRRDTMNTGVEYVADLGGRFAPEYTWRAFPLQIGAINESITTPDTIMLESPRGGSLIQRKKDLALRWRGGKGTLTVILSRYVDPKRGFAPLLEFRVRSNTGKAFIPASILKQLPPNLYLLTFVLSNKRETVTVQRYTGTMYIQAASIYNCYVGLQ
jgi:hypothetical protein